MRCTKNTAGLKTSFSVIKVICLTSENGAAFILFEFIQPICWKWPRDGATKPSSTTGKDIQTWWRSICVNYLWLKRTLPEVKFHSAVCGFTSPPSKKIGLWIPLVHATVLTAGQKRRAKAALCRFSRNAKVPRRRASCDTFTTLLPPLGDQPFQSVRMGNVCFNPSPLSAVILK